MADTARRRGDERVERAREVNGGAHGIRGCVAAMARHRRRAHRAWRLGRDTLRSTRGRAGWTECGRAISARLGTGNGKWRCCRVRRSSGIAERGRARRARGSRHGRARRRGASERARKSW
eukprot:6319422-Prymnesium_polylepis.1